MLKYFSGDLETTGLDPKVCSILEFGVIFASAGEDKELYELKAEGRVFHCYVNISDEDLEKGDPFALNLNAGIIECIKKQEEGYLYLNKEDVWPTFLSWASQWMAPEDRMTFAGKNFGSFDMKFIELLPGFERIGVRSRFLDPGILFMDWKNDVAPPSLTECLKRAGLESHVTHTAVEDAYQVVQLIDHHVNK